MKPPSEYLKMQVLGMVDHATGASIRDRIKTVSQMTFTDEEGNPRRFTWRTIETWRVRYNKHGVTALKRTPRSDKGRTRHVTPQEVEEALAQVLPHFHGKKLPPKAALYRACIERGLLQRDKIAPNTFSRMLNEYELLKPADQSSKRVRQAFAKAHANQLWQADTMFGPYLPHGTINGKAGRKVPVKLIAFVDDASRVCVHGQFFVKEDTASLVEAFKLAFYKRGVPDALYVDNGAIYTSREIVQICARVGCLLNHAPLRDGAAKGKVERFFRTVRDQFLVRDLSTCHSIDDLNRQFTQWSEGHYNTQKHGTLGMSPLDRFALDANRIRYLPQNEFNDELFYVEEDRTTRSDNTFSFTNLRYEAPAHLPDRKIQIRYERAHPRQRVIVFYKGERIGEARPVDFQANDRKRDDF